MKKYKLVVIVFLSIFLNAAIAFAVPDTWTQKADFGGAARYDAAGFSIGSKAYVGTGYDGSTYYKDFWRYDPATDAWTQVADFGGATGIARRAAVGLSINGNGYVGTGYDGSTYYKDFWAYDPDANQWTQKVDFGGTARYGAAGFAIGTKGYLGTGYDGSTYYRDLWEYDTVNNAWTPKRDLTFSILNLRRFAAVGFAIGSKGYIGTGRGQYTTWQDLWEYDPATDQWANRASLPEGARYDAVGFTIGTKGYIGMGYIIAATTVYYKDFWEYDPAANTWSKKADFGDATAPDETGRSASFGFSIGGKGYVGAGHDGSIYYRDFWEYDSGINTVPDPFILTDQTNVARNTVMTSNTITVSGLGAAAFISIAGGTYSINGGLYVNTDGTVNNGDTVSVRQTSSASYSTKTNATLTIGGLSDTFSVTTLAAPPDQFIFTDQTDVPLSMVMTSNTITVSGLGAPATISITGGTYSINGGPYINTNGTVSNGDTVSVRQTSSASYSTKTDATLTIGSVSDTFSVTTRAVPPDTTPDPFTFTDQTGMPLNTVITSNTITVSGISAAAVISITGGTYSINGGAYVNTVGTVNNNDTVTVQQTSAGNYVTKTDATLTIGGLSDTFSVTTLAAPADMTPEPFTFNDQVDAPLSTGIMSNTITVSGISSPTPISITGGTYSINGGTYVNTVGTVNNNDTITVQVTSAGNYATKTDATLTIGGLSDTFSVTTLAAPADMTPDQFIFDDQTDVSLSTGIMSNTITVSGISSPAPISITGGTYSINGGAYVNTVGTVNNGDTVAVQLISSGSYSTRTETTLTIGGVSDTFSVTTKDEEDDNCFIATAAFGSPLAAQVKILRQFRDKYLLTHALGRKFVSWYYRNGPVAASWIKDKPLAKGIVQTALYPLIGFSSLLISGYLPFVTMGFLLSALLFLRFRPKKLQAM